MKNIIFLSGFMMLAAFQNSFAQQDSVLYEVQYKISQKNVDTTKSPSVQTVLFVVSKNKFLEVNNDAFKTLHQQYINEYIRLKRQEKTGISAEDATRKIAADIAPFNEKIYDLKRRKIMTFDVIGMTFYVETLMPDIKWKIVEEEKVIMGYPCNRAIGASNNGDIKVWFTKEIPIDAGLGGMTGLPGLVLGGENSKGISFEVTQIHKGSKFFSNISMPSQDPKKITAEQLKLNKEWYKKDPTGFLKSLLPPGTEVREFKSQ